MGFAVLPEFVPYVPGMMVKSLDGEHDESLADLPEAFYGAVGPNPGSPGNNVGHGSAGFSSIPPLQSMIMAINT